MAVPIGRFEVLMNLVDSPKPFNSLKIRIESSTMALTNLTTFGVAFGATVLEVDVKVEYRC
jgi:hypothetical protein